MIYLIEFYQSCLTSKVRFKDVEEYKRNTTVQFNIILKRSLSGAPTNETLTGMIVLNAKKTILKRINVSFIFFSCLFPLFVIEKELKLKC